MKLKGNKVPCEWCGGAGEVTACCVAEAWDDHRCLCCGRFARLAPCPDCEGQMYQWCEFSSASQREEAVAFLRANRKMTWLYEMSGCRKVEDVKSSLLLDLANIVATDMWCKHKQLEG